MTRSRALALVSLLSLALVTASALAQESGGSFGGSDWGSSESSGGGASSGSSSSPSYEPPSAPSGPDYAQQQADDQARRDREAAAAAAAAAAAEAERQREEAERIAADRARKLALPPGARVHELSWPPSPPYAPIHSPVLPIDAPPPASARASDPAWVAPTEPVEPSASVVVEGEPHYVGPFCCATPFILVLVLAALWLTRSPSRRPELGPFRAPTGPAMRVSIAFDWSARAALQIELAAMAKRFDMRSRAGLGQGARAMAQLLAGHEGAVRYATWELSQGDARSWFQTRANDLRARYRAELVRNESTAASPDFVARANEGEGLVVVSVVVATTRPIPPPPATFSLPGVHAAIAAIGGSAASETIALEVIWSPAAENDRMSSYELEKIYPELQRLTTGVGARECTYCHGPFPAELPRCPNCGAPI